MLAAYELASAIAPPATWRGAAARVVAGRLAMNLGAPRLGRVLHCLAFREDGADPEAAYYFARAILERRGPLSAWEFVKSRGELPAGPDAVQADWLAFHAQILGGLRDFETAERWLARAEEVSPNRPWTCIERADLLERQDRYDDALAAARHGLELHAWYRPAVQSVAHLLQLLDRDEEALTFLREATANLVSAPVVMQLASVETDLGLYEAARANWEKAVDLCPMREKAFEQFLCARRSDAAYYCGDHERAAELAEQAKNPFHEEAAKKLRETRGKGQRVVLQVGFVRQHHMTCAPATLSALSRFWSMPAHHLEVAEAICYDGTPAHSERAWAEKSGYVAREFRVDWNAAVALIDRGVPFTFTTVEPGSAHLQAVIGYDSLRGTLLIRDPYMRQFAEFIADAAFKRYTSTGPRGMLLAPADRAAALLEGIELPDAPLYDLMHDVQRALVAHDRAAARAACQRMAQEAPDHRLTLWAQRSLASYDADPTEGLALTERLLAAHPDDPNLQLGKLSYLRVLARREERLAMLSAICDTKGSDPVFWQQLAMELKEDAREQPRALRLIRRALRFRRADASSYRALGKLLWDQRRFEEATEVFRFAACIDDKDESLARSYFIASRHLKQTDAALRMLKDRFARFGRRSSWPVRSLVFAYEQLNRDEEAMEALAEAQKLRPDDGDLQLFAASAQARRNRFDEAAALLAAAKGRTAPNSWLRVAAEVAMYRGESAEALSLWQQIAAAEPLAYDAHRSIARLLAETASPAAALDHLEKNANRFPHNYRLTQLWLEWIRDEGPVAAEPVIRRLMEIHPADGWVRRELALVLSQTNRLQDALAEAETSLRLEPSNPSAPFYRGLVLARLGRIEEAKADYRQAIRLSVDADFAITQLVNASDTLEQKRQALDFVQKELVRQTIFGDGLLAYRAQASEVLEAGELLEKLKEALAARPDLWHAWSAVAMQLSEMGQGAEAERIATQATERFPLLPRMWLDLASVYGANGNFAGQAAALETALELSPGWTRAVRALAEVYERSGEFEKSRQLLEQSIRRTPLDPYNHGGLADLLWKRGDREAALARIEHAVKLEPGYKWAWDALTRWSATLKRPDVAVRTARELTVRRAGEARSWLVLARTLDGSAALEERLAAVERAIALNPHGVEAHDLKAWLLSSAGRYDEAIAACAPPIFGEHLPSRLRGRAAWVEAERGNLPLAISQMQQIVSQDPHYYWAWTCLADWYRQTKADADYLKTALSLTRLFPLDTVSQGYLGEALLRTGDRAGARGVLERVMQKAPDYDFAANTLFEMALQDKQLDLAEQALATLRLHNPGDATTGRSGRLAALRGDARGAIAALGELSRSTGDEAAAEQFGAVVAAMEKNALAKDANLALRALLEQPEPHPFIASQLVELLCRQKAWRSAAQAALQERGRPALWTPAAATLLNRLGAARAGSEVWRFLQIAGKAARQETRIWGAVSYALKTLRWHRRLIRFMSDWAGRNDAESWMLVNLANAYRAIGNRPMAQQVNRRAIALPEPSLHRGMHLLWLAFDAALEGDVAEASAHLAVPESNVDRPLYRFLRGMTQTLLSARAKASRPTLIKEFQAAAAKREFAAEREFRGVYFATLRKLALIGPGVGVRAWALIKLLSVDPFSGRIT